MKELAQLWLGIMIVTGIGIGAWNFGVYMAKKDHAPISKVSGPKYQVKDCVKTFTQSDEFSPKVAEYYVILAVGKESYRTMRFYNREALMIPSLRSFGYGHMEAVTYFSVLDKEETTKVSCRDEVVPIMNNIIEEEKSRSED